MGLREVISGRSEPDLVAEPLKVFQIELSEPLPPLEASAGPMGTWYRQARVLVRLHGHPMGFVTIELAESPPDHDELIAQIWLSLGEVIRSHLERDGIAIDNARISTKFPIAQVCLQSPRFPENPPLVSVVICTMGRPRQLKDALEALLVQTYSSYEIIVVDNQPSNPSTLELIERYSSHPIIRYVAEPQRGLSQARNRGLAESNGEYVAFTDDDIVVDKHWLTSLTGGFSDDTIACVTGITLARELETPSQTSFEQYGAFNQGYASRLFSADTNPSTTALYPYTAGVFGGGGNSAIKLSCFPHRPIFDVRLGPGTPTFGAEDLDVFLTVIRSGYRIHYTPTALAWHEHRRTFAELRWQIFTYGVGLTAYLTKWIVKDPRILIDLGRAAWKHRRRLGEKSPRVDLGHPFPPELRRLERMGYLYGPFAWVRSLLTIRRS